MNSQVLVIGAHGQVGQLVVAHLAGAFQVHAWSRADVDLTDIALLQQKIVTLKPAYVINAAAYTAVDKAESEPELADLVNHQAVAAMAKACAEVDAVLLHLSTDYVFAGTGEHAYTEADATGPVSVYGQTKLAGEQAALALWHKVIVIRTAWVFAENGQNFVKTILKFAREKSELTVVDDQIGGPTHADDIAIALVSIVAQLEAGLTNAWGIYHFSGYPYVSWYQFTQALLDSLREGGYSGVLAALKPVDSSQFVRPARRPANSRLNCQKIESVFGIMPSDWQQHIRHLTGYLST